MAEDPTTFREHVLIHAVDYAEENGAGQYHPFEAVITRATSDPMRTRDALAYWCRYRRDGAKDTILWAYGGDPSKGSYAVNDESRRMRDYVALLRRQGGTQIGTVHGAVHTGSGNLSVSDKAAPGVSASGSPSLNAAFWFTDLARRIQDHVDKCFDNRDMESAEAGPFLAIHTSMGTWRGFVRFVRHDANANRFVLDPNGSDGVRIVDLFGKPTHVPIGEIRGVADADH